MKPKTYSEKLQDPRWQKKRLLIYERDNWKCVECGASNNTLHVHHKKYFKGANPWDYDDAYLATLCESCHQKEHGICENKEIDHSVFETKAYLPDVVNDINFQIHELTEKLNGNSDTNLETDVLKNIKFLYDLRDSFTLKTS